MLLNDMKKNEIILPNTIVVGAEKAGTTTIANVMARHPEIFMGKPKEVRFFSDHTNGHHHWHKGLDWYRRKFEDAGNARIVGEASPSYTWYPVHPHVPERMHRVLGDIRLIYMVRNPVSRMISHYAHALYHHWVPPRASLHEAIRLRPELIECSRYDFQMRQYDAFSCPRNWHVACMEDLKESPSKLMDGLSVFLGLREKLRVPDKARNVTAGKVVLPARLERFCENSVMRRVLHSRVGLKLFGLKFVKPRLTKEERRRFKDFFRLDVIRLSERTGTDFLTRWNYVGAALAKLVADFG